MVFTPLCLHGQSRLGSSDPGGVAQGSALNSDSPRPCKFRDQEVKMCINQRFGARVILHPGASGAVWRGVWRSSLGLPEGYRHRVDRDQGAAHHPVTPRTDAPTTSRRL